MSKIEEILGVTFYENYDYYVVEMILRDGRRTSIRVYAGERDGIDPLILSAIDDFEKKRKKGVK